MAQVRVDEVLLNDFRFKELVRLILDRIGDIISREEAEDFALATCVRVFWLAQSYWRKDRQRIPHDVWKIAERSSPNLALLLSVGLVEFEEDGIYVRGSKDFFDWYHDKTEAGRRGGIQSGETRKKNAILKRSKQGNEASEAGQRSKRSRGTKQRTCSVSVPVSSSVSVSDSVSVSVSESESQNTGEGVLAEPPSQAIVPMEPVEAEYQEPPPKPPKKAKAPSDGAQVWEAYAHAYEQRYGTPPVRNARVNGQCAQLVARLGAERAAAVVRFFLTHQSRYYVQTVHTLGACLKDAEALWTQMQTGQRITSATANEADKGQANEDVFKKLARKWDAEDSEKKTNEGDRP
jgi:hypothetical protein